MTSRTFDSGIISGTGERCLGRLPDQTVGEAVPALGDELWGRGSAEERADLPLFDPAGTPPPDEGTRVVRRQLAAVTSVRFRIGAGTHERGAVVSIEEVNNCRTHASEGTTAAREGKP